MSMAKKMFLENRKYIFFIIGAYLIISSSSQESEFKCYPDDLRVIEIFGKNFTCPKGQFCDQDLRSPTPTCSDATIVCEPFFQCVEDVDDVYKVGDGNNLSCPTDHVCNRNLKKSCKPCVPVIEAIITTITPPPQVLHKCFSDDLTIIEIYGRNYTCDEGMLCDKNSRDFLPCSNASIICESFFKCMNDTMVDVVDVGNNLPCPKDYVCNRNPKKTCAPCVQKPCPKTYKCVNKTSVKLPNFPEPINCGAGLKCNSEYLQPCNPCIANDDPHNTLTLAPSTKSSYSLDQDFEASATTTLTSIKTIPGASTPTTSTITTTTTEDDGKSSIPNCNDGEGRTRPCRKAKRFEGIYYQCYRVVFWYQYKVLPCSRLHLDKLCREVTGICY